MFFFVISAQNQADYLSRPDTTTAMLDTDAYRRGGLAWLSVQEHERFKVMLFPNDPLVSAKRKF